MFLLFWCRKNMITGRCLGRQNLDCWGLNPLSTEAEGMSNSVNKNPQIAGVWLENKAVSQRFMKCLHICQGSPWGTAWQPQVLVTITPHQHHVCHCQPVLGQAGVVSTGVQVKYAEGKVLQDAGRTLCPSAHCRKLLFPSWAACRLHCPVGQLEGERLKILPGLSAFPPRGCRGIS